VIDPDNPFATSDNVRILLLQFSSMLVEHASPHIHDANNKLVIVKTLLSLYVYVYMCVRAYVCLPICL